MQLTSETAVCVDQAAWKKLQVLPGQTILETVALKIPAVRAKTRFLTQWSDENGNVLGTTEVAAYPTNLLAELGVLLNHAEGALGVFDPENQLKPLLGNLNVCFFDLERSSIENYRGKLAIIGPFEPGSQTRFIGSGQIKSLSEHGVAVVWVQPPTYAYDEWNDEPQPSFYSVPGVKAAVVVVQPKMLARLAANPRSQLNLIYFCKLALHPQPSTLPFSNRQP